MEVWGWILTISGILLLVTGAVIGIKGFGISSKNSNQKVIQNMEKAKTVNARIIRYVPIKNDFIFGPMVWGALVEYNINGIRYQKQYYMGQAEAGMAFGFSFGKPVSNIMFNITEAKRSGTPNPELYPPKHCFPVNSFIPIYFNPNNPSQSSFSPFYYNPNKVGQSEITDEHSKKIFQKALIASIVIANLGLVFCEAGFILLLASKGVI